MTYLARGFALWRRRPGLMALGMVPALLVALVFLALFVALLVELGSLTSTLTFFADGWAASLRDLLRVLVAVVLVLGAVLLVSVTFTGLTLAVGDPFYERIWRETEAMLGGPVPSGDLGMWRAAREGLVVAALGAATSVGVVVVGFLPVVGTVLGAVAGVTVSGWLLAGELLGRPLEARGLDRAARRALLRPHRTRVLGFGLSTQLCFLVPLGAVVAMPAAVAGATILARDLLAEGSVGGGAAGLGEGGGRTAGVVEPREG